MVAKLKPSALKHGDLVAWDEFSRRYHIIRTASVERVTGRNLWTMDGNVLWMPDLNGLRIASKDDIERAR